MEKQIVRQLTTPTKENPKEPLCYLYKQFGSYAVHCPLYGVHVVFGYANENEGLEAALEKYWLYVEKILHSHFYTALTEEGF